MGRVVFTGVISGAVEGESIASSLVVSTAAGARVFDHSSGFVMDLNAASSGIANATVQDGLGPRYAVDLDGANMSLSRAVLEAAVINAEQGDGGGVTVFLDPIAAQVYAGTMVCAKIDLTTFAFVSAVQGSGVAVFEVDEDTGGLVQVFAASDTTDSFGAGITAMTFVETPAGPFLYVGSGNEHGVTGFSVGHDGSLENVENYGQSLGLPVQDITAIDSVTVGGEHFVVVAAAGSSSLTVMEVQPDGRLRVSDHILDDLNTRFQGVCALEVIELGEQALVLAAGADMGLSIFTLTPNGRLVLFETLADTLDYGLDRVSGITATRINDRVEIFVTSQGDAGVSQFTIAMADLPSIVDVNADPAAQQAAGETVALVGGAQSDIIVDGQGIGQLEGGAGADVFVLSEDGEYTRIRDYEFGVDRIDISDWSFLYHASQLDVSARGSGALRLRFGEEMVDVFSSDGRALVLADFDALDFDLVNHVSIQRGPLPEAEPEPEPEPPLPGAGQTLYGSSGGNTLEGGDGDDIFHPGAGDDVIIFGGGSDLVYGDSGTDIVSYAGASGGIVYDLSGSVAAAGEAADDTLSNIEGLIGTDYRDVLYGDDKANVFHGEGGRDRLDGGAGADTLFGGDGNDALLGRDGNDVIYGGAGNDNIPGAGGDDRLYGGDGNDAMGGSYGNDQIFGGAGNDVIGAGYGEDFIYGGPGRDLMSGGSGSDTLFGGGGDDMVAGSFSSDTTYGGEGNDEMGGGFGQDHIYGGAGDDVVGAGGHNDRIYGEAGDDTLNGGDGDDWIFGGSGGDRINGGADDDVMTGGDGSDVFVFTAYQTGENDRIVDFELGVDVLRMAYIGGATAEVKMNKLQISQVEDDTLIEWRGHDILLQDTRASDLDPDDFLFV